MPYSTLNYRDHPLTPISPPQPQGHIPLTLLRTPDKSTKSSRLTLGLPYTGALTVDSSRPGR